jgi:hypothetical protein
MLPHSRKKNYMIWLGFYKIIYYSIKLLINSRQRAQSGCFEREKQKLKAATIPFFVGT